MILPYPADGATYRMEAEQLEAVQVISSPSFTVEACADDNGNFSTGFFNMFPPADYGSSYDEECELVIGSYDPNDKTPTPLGYGEEHFIEKNVDLKYLIRFQNTGTDTAFTVVVKDTLSEYFDINSLQVGVVSHAYSLRILEGNILEFRFDNILLTDSTTNEPESHGFINYTLKQKNDLPLGTVIKNSAAIYFDFNDPIITNETYHTIGENFITTNINNVVGKNIDLEIYPNPMTDRTIFHLKDVEFQTGQLQLFDLLGRPLRLSLIHI